MARPTLNPFRTLFETERAPHARTLRTSLLQKFKDAYKTIHGEFGPRKNQRHLGLYDYATLFIPLILERAIPVFGVYLFTPPRVLISFIATLVAAPVILGVHFLSSLVNWVKGTKEDALKLALVTENYGSDVTLSRLLQDVDIEKVTFKVEKTCPPAAEAMASEPNQGQSYKLRFYSPAIAQSPPIYSFSTDISQEQKRSFSALSALNIGHIADSIKQFDAEDREALREFGL